MDLKTPKVGPYTRDMVIDYVYYCLVNRDYADQAAAVLVNMGAQVNQYPKHQALLRHLGSEFERSECGCSHLIPFADVFDPASLDSQPDFITFLDKNFSVLCRSLFWKKIIVAVAATGRLCAKAASIRRIDLIEDMANWLICYMSEHVDEKMMEYGGWDDFLAEYANVRTCKKQSTEEFTNTLILTAFAVRLNTEEHSPTIDCIIGDISSMVTHSDIHAVQQIQQFYDWLIEDEANKLILNRAVQEITTHRDYESLELSCKQLNDSLDHYFKEKINWGRICYAVIFSTEVCKKYVEREYSLAVYRSLDCINKFFKNTRKGQKVSLNEWIYRKGGWECMPYYIQKDKEDITTISKIRSQMSKPCSNIFPNVLAFCATVGFGAICWWVITRKKDESITWKECLERMETTIASPKLYNFQYN